MECELSQRSRIRAHHGVSPNSGNCGQRRPLLSVMWPLLCWYAPVHSSPRSNLVGYKASKTRRPKWDLNLVRGGDWYEASRIRKGMEMRVTGMEHCENNEECIFKKGIKVPAFSFLSFLPLFCHCCHNGLNHLTMRK